ncbi:MAG: CoA-acylating methylmalonate-semialdehyde dehydrogenase [Planctomycetota bacterium]
MSEKIKNLINGKWCEPTGSESYPLLNPADESSLGVFTTSSQDDLLQAIAGAKQAQEQWQKVPMIKRCRILFHCKELLEQQLNQISECLVRENGKCLPEAEAEMRRGLEVLELACGMPSLSKGDYFPEIANQLDGYMIREPLGVVAGICPFNFPAMIPMWMFPIAIALGNSFILKPSEKCPMTANMIAEVMLKGGLPAGVLNVVQGTGEAGKILSTHPDIKAVSFVGSTPAAQKVWETATAERKRVQALGGAKNFLFVMPDASPEDTVKGILGSAFGCAGERCMATSIIMLIGDCSAILKQVVEQAGAIRLGNGLHAESEMGPLISSEHRDRVLAAIESGVEQGAKLILDGRKTSGPECDKGFFLAPSILDEVTIDMPVARQEIFGPVLSVMRAAGLEEAIAVANKSTFGNGASIFTQSGAAAGKFRREIDCGMIGINTGVPAPMAFISFGGFKDSLYGDLKVQGTEGIDFYTRRKAVIDKWFGQGDVWGN